MPFFGFTSLLSLHREARKKQFKKLFGSIRKMVVSDSTMKRVLSWLSRKVAIVFLIGFLRVFEIEGLSRKSFQKTSPAGGSGSLMDPLWALIIWLPSIFLVKLTIRFSWRSVKNEARSYQLLQYS
jgi:hypothetical protein